MTMTMNARVRLLVGGFVLMALLAATAILSGCLALAAGFASGQGNDDRSSGNDGGYVWDPWPPPRSNDDDRTVYDSSDDDSSSSSSGSGDSTSEGDSNSSGDSGNASSSGGDEDSFSEDDDGASVAGLEAAK